MAQVVVLAGGLGTRMGARTERVPKVLLEVAGRPFLDHLLERLVDSKIDRVLLLVGHLGERVTEHLAALGETRLKVTVHQDGEKLLGTAGALKNAEQLLEETFLVTYGDSYLGFDYREPLRLLLEDETARGCMAVYRNQGALEPSNVRVLGDKVTAYDKRATGGGFDWIDYGAIALRRQVVEELPAGVTIGLDRVQAELAARGLLLACPVEERFFEIGSPSGLADLEAKLG